MKILLLPLFCLLAFNLHGQITKGASPLSAATDNNGNGTTRAVVIGISDYQNPGIPDLQFANRDAEAFAEYLQSKAGGSLTKDQVKLLTNEQATGGKIISELTWLIDASGAGNVAIIYFSGHGDVETVTKRKNGYLLPYNSPFNNYMMGAFSLRDLQDIISTLSEGNVQVIVITDACRSGTLAGSGVNGAQATSAVLAQQFSNEVKILSCQPEEYSLEGEQWGGGRGAFSYHFVDGLYGLADRNGDQMVNLSEIDRYLEDHVTPETAPLSQIPMTVGSKTAHLANVDIEMLAQVKALKVNAEPTLAHIESKGVEEDVLAATDPTTRELFLAFKKALENGDLMTPSGTSANDLYIKLSKEHTIAPLHGYMRRNLAAALLDGSQDVINNTLKNDPAELAKMFGRGLYRHIPGYLDRAAGLLGEGHYIYDRVMGQKYAFEAYNILTNTPSKELFILQNQNAIPLAKKSLELLGPGAFIYDLLGALYSPVHADSAAYFFRKAVQLSPTYASPYNNEGVMYSWVRNPFLKTKYYKKAIKTDPGYFPAYDNIGAIYSRKKNYKKAEAWYNRSIGVFPNALAYSNLGRVYFEQGWYEEAETACLKGIEIMPTYYRSYLVLADIYRQTHEDAKLSSLLPKMEELADARHGDYAEIAMGYLYLKDYPRFRSNYYKADARIEQFPPTYFYEVCRTYAQHGKKKEALNWLELAFNRGFHDRKKLRKDEALDSIRGEARFRELKKKYGKKVISCEDCIWSAFRAKG